VQRGAIVRHVDLATCRTRTTRAGRQITTRTPTIVATRRSQTIVYRGKAVYAVRER
jgi:actin-like ATPase involved in cell morphogenesis